MSVPQPRQVLASSKPSNFTEVASITSGTSGHRGGEDKDETTNIDAEEIRNINDIDDDKDDKEEIRINTPVKVRIQRLEAGFASKGGSIKKKSKRKREEVLDTGQKKIVEFFLRKAKADLNRETAVELGAHGNDGSDNTSDRVIQTQTEECGKSEQGRGKKRTRPVLGRWLHEAKNPTNELNNGEQEDSTRVELDGEKTKHDKDIE